LKKQKLKKKKALTKGGLKTPTIEKHRYVGGNERDTRNTLAKKGLLFALSH
jgi:hypothetical protein